MVSREFADNVQKGNVDTVRSALLDYLTVDKSFKTFDEALVYASQSMSVVQKYDDDPFEVDKEKWDKRYLNQQKAALLMNFATERISHLKEVISFLNAPEASASYHAEIPVQKVATSANGERHTGRTKDSETEIVHTHSPTSHRSADSQQEHSADKTSSGKTGKRTISETELPSSESTDGKSQSGFPFGTVMIAGGAAVAVAGAIAAKPILIGAGVVIAGTGCVVNATNKRK